MRENSYLCNALYIPLTAKNNRYIELQIKKMNIMEENKKKHYVTPSMKVYKIEPTQILAGSFSSSTTVNDWGNGGFLGSGEIVEE